MNTHVLLWFGLPVNGKFYCLDELLDELLAINNMANTLGWKSLPYYKVHHIYWSTRFLRNRNCSPLCEFSSHPITCFKLTSFRVMNLCQSGIGIKLIKLCYPQLSNVQREGLTHVILFPKIAGQGARDRIKSLTSPVYYRLEISYL